MYYILIILVAAGHIHQKIVANEFGADIGFQPDGHGYYRSAVDCNEELDRLKTFKPAKGVKVVTMECREADLQLNYYPWGIE